MLLWIIIAIVAIFLGTIIIRALNFNPQKKPQCKVGEAEVNADQTAEHLAQMIRCKTVSLPDPSITDPSEFNKLNTEFEKFRALLIQLYPTLHRVCQPERIGPTGLLYKLKGKSNAEPKVLMSHYDVVPADEAAWEKPPFAGVIENGILWGRGTLDTKNTLCSIMEAAEQLAARGFTPENDLYLAFCGDEETTGRSAREMVEKFLQRGVKPAMVLDEGGAVVKDIFPGVKDPCALVGIAEKGLLDIELSAESSGGHASAPPPHTPIGRLAKAVTRIEARPFRSRLTAPVAQMFDILGRRSPFIYKLIFANLWCFKPVLDAICRKNGGELNAMIRTTCAFTMMEGSRATNVIPVTAKIRANLRLIGSETTDSAIAYLKSAAKDPQIKFRMVQGNNPSIYSKTSGHGWDILNNAIGQTWPQAVAAPYLMMACSDSRFYCRISDRVYRFSAAFLSKEERALIHGNNERIPVETLAKTAQFYLRLMEQC